MMRKKQSRLIRPQQKRNRQCSTDTNKQCLCNDCQSLLNEMGKRTETRVSGKTEKDSKSILHDIEVDMLKKRLSFVLRQLEKMQEQLKEEKRKNMAYEYVCKNRLEKLKRRMGYGENIVGDSVGENENVLHGIILIQPNCY